MTGLPNVSAKSIPKSILCRTRLSPPTLHQHDDASTHHDKNDDGGERFHRGQGLVPVVPKLKHVGRPWRYHSILTVLSDCWRRRQLYRAAGVLRTTSLRTTSLQRVTSCNTPRAPFDQEPPSSCVSHRAARTR